MNSPGQGPTRTLLLVLLQLCELEHQPIFLDSALASCSRIPPRLSNNHMLWIECCSAYRHVLMNPPGTGSSPSWFPRAALSWRDEASARISGFMLLLLFWIRQGLYTNHALWIESHHPFQHVPLKAPGQVQQPNLFDRCCRNMDISAIS